MTHTREAVALMACWIGLTASSCTFQAHSPRPLSIQNNPAQQTVVRPSTQAISDAGSASDCVLSRDEVHLWCKWITRYY
jgi:hypothetical protein